MGPVGSRNVFTHDKPHAGTAAFLDDASASPEQALNVPPGNRGTDRISENRQEDFALAVVHTK
jgi:hypothetical protein